ncbi:conjugal transfer protein [Kitasatospora sp. NPDC059088]|uniref:conjugal transfer protein n=1 Tax=Kitasatospora sp. NPDC059088 TaxID=3346722 RepID=UPI0036A4E5FD
MSLFSFRRNPPDDEADSVVVPAEALRRRGRLTHAARYALWASIACGPVALLAVVPVAKALAKPAVLAAPPAPTVIPAPTGYAELFVDLWLRSSSQAATGGDVLHSMAPGIDLPQPADKSTLSVQRVVAVRSQPMGGRTWLVTVAATMSAPATAGAAGGSQSSQSPVAPSQSSQPTPAATSGGSQSSTALVVRYYAVPVSMVRGPSSGGAPDSLSVTAAPAQVSGPLALSGSDGTTGPYGTQVQAGPLQQAVSEYLTAYLTGVGESSRYLSPGVKIPPAGAVYQKVELVSLAARTPVPAAPADGAVLDVLAQVRATDASGQWPLAYPLHLRARAGRWEVAALAPAAPSTSPSSSPSPSSSLAPSSPAAPAPASPSEVR